VEESRNYRVGVTLQIDNYSKWPLTLPIFYENSGYVISPPIAVQPGTKEMMVMRKTGYIAAGSYGTVSWDVNGKMRLAVMWSAPFNFDFHSNTLAVGIIGADDHYTSSLADTMYNDKGTFTRQEYDYDGTKAIKYCNSEICVHGSMGTSHHPHISISVFPMSNRDFANGVGEYINLNNLQPLIYQ